MKKDNYIFPAIFDYAEDGISIEFPDLPGCLSCADSDAEALHNAKEALRGWLLVSEDGGDDIPEPTSLQDITLQSNQKAILVDVCLALYRDAFKNRSVKKTLTIPSWLNERAEQENINFSYVLQNALKEQIETIEGDMNN
ncbi:MAG: type II toxin-antitoxin system HicB family antitoxin [Lachnoclostridium sp.]|jgi:predicted RNase H-like HicB family nuclease|nr:type II toxin-antitoxin system HicB family antitoxin [Lachnoclostridium sp.]